MAEDNVKYEVVTEFRITGADQGAANVNKLSGAASKLDRASSGAMGAVAKLGGAIAGYFGARKLYSGFIEYNATLEETRNRLSALYEVQGRMSESSANARATSDLKAYRDMSRQVEYSALELSDIGRSYVGSTRDLNLEQARYLRLVHATAAAQKYAGIDAGDVSAMVRGNAIVRERSAAWKSLQPTIGGTAEQFKKLNQVARFAKVEDALGKYLEKENKEATSFSDMMKIVRNNVRETFADTGASAFDKAKSSVSDLIKNLQAGSGSGFIQGLASGMEKAASFAGFLARHLDTVVSLGTTALKIYGAMKLTGWVQSFAGRFGAGGAASSAGAASALGGAVGTMAVTAGVVNVMGGSAGGSSSYSMNTATMGLAGGSAAAAAGASSWGSRFKGMVMPGIGGAIMGGAIGSENGIGGAIAGSIAGAGATIAASFIPVIGPFVAPFAGALAGMVTNWFGDVLSASKPTTPLGEESRGHAETFLEGFSIIAEDRARLSEALENFSAGGGIITPDVIRGFAGELAIALSQTKKDGGKGGTHIHGDVKITVEANDDPWRVAQTWDGVMHYLKEQPHGAAMEEGVPL